MESVELLKKKRTQIKKRLARCKNLLTSNTSNITCLNALLSDIQKCREDFFNIQSSIDDQSEEIDDKQHEEFENNYYELIVEIKALISSASISDVASNASVVTAVNKGLINVNLPKINLPNYNGAYESWMSFRDTYLSLSHNNSSLSNIEKFHYLKASLSGEAAKLIDSLELAEDYYPIAWKTIIDRYENTKQIIKNHCKALLSLPTAIKSNVREILDLIQKNIRALKACKQPVEHWSTLLIAIITNKFDFKINEEWESATADSDLPTFEDLITFLTKKAKISEAIYDNKFTYNNKQKHVVENKIRKSFIVSNPAQIKCHMCNSDHNIRNCTKFLRLNANSRFEFVKSKKLCINCLRDGHRVTNCTSSNCKTCGSKHNSLLHFEKNNWDKENTSAAPKINVESVTKDEAPVNALHAIVNSQVFLSTASVIVHDDSGNSKICRALLDSGSQCNFVTNNVVKNFKLSLQSINAPVVGINNVTKTIKNLANLTVSSRYNEFEFQSKFLIVDNISQRLPAFSVTKESLKIPLGLDLADPQFNTPMPVDMLIGAEVYYDILCKEQLKYDNLPTLQNTHFGWIVAGRYENKPNPNTKLHCNMSFLENQMKNFWEIEDVNESDTLTINEKHCEEHFLNTHYRLPSGRFVIKMPLKESVVSLGASKTMALKRLHSVENKFVRNESLRNDYVDFMKEYKQLGHMRKINDINDNNSINYYLPHHAVLKSSSLTTKLRVVFDASAKSSNGKSLNDLLYVGPTIQQDLFALITRFRMYKFALTADIAKMYRQILVDDSQTSLQRILWRDSPQDEISTYELKTVTYGTATAPFLATRCLKQLADDDSADLPLAGTVVRRDFYVDDLITGANTVQEALEIRNQTIDLLKRGCFDIRKWASNEASLIEDLSTDVENYIIDFNDSKYVKTLGVNWNPKIDSFSFAFTPRSPQISTKRSILAVIASIFDPLGLIAPIVVRGKLLIQELWKLKIGWEDPVSEELATLWTVFIGDLTVINSFRIPRNVVANKSSIKYLEFHGFSDACDKAYGACLYVRTLCIDGTVSCNLLCAKSRVAPIKKLTTPRLELCGALLLAKLSARVLKTINTEFSKKYYWTDSTIVLAWIKSESKKFTTFVGNRVQQIHNFTNPTEWHHVRTYDNPADAISRGLHPDALRDSSLWWHGPPWLKLPSEHWQSNEIINENDLLELDTIPIVSNIATIDVNEYVQRFSKLERLLKVTSYLFRFMNNCKLSTSERNFSYVTPNELQHVKFRLIRLIQERHFEREIENLKAAKNIDRNSKLKQLQPFLINDIIRVGGRLKNADISTDQRYPIVLPSAHKFSELIIEYTHRKNLHAGVELTLATIRNQYWIINAKNKIKKIIHRCVQCFKAKPRTIRYEMGDLPACRVNKARPFLNCGVDFGGPILLKQGGRRSKTLLKAYIALFVCLASKAVHIDLVTSLSSEAFIAVLKRLEARRGKIANIWSDNGTTFVGADRELKELYNFFKNDNKRAELVDATSIESVKWHFIPPQAPHFGGIWEAAIKSCKFHLKRIVGTAKLTYEEMHTVLVQVEAILNSRPIIPISSDPNDLSALTPGHLLIGDSLQSVPEPNIAELKTTTLARWQYLEQVRQHFWNRWYKEYLGSLQQRTKWNKKTFTKIKIGDLVVLSEQNMPPLYWPMGRIIETHPGKDGIIRAVTLKTAKGTFKRPAIKIALLPIQEE